MKMVKVWTWDYGNLAIAPSEKGRRLGWIVSKLVNNGLWREFQKIPPRLLKRALPFLECPSHTKQFIRLYLKVHHT